jgi:hypothetical protein
MSDATILAIVTTICSAVIVVFQLLTKSEVTMLKTKVEEQTVEIARLHQTIIVQSATIYDTEATKKGAGRQPHKLPPDEPYTANPPYRPNK